MRLILGRNTDSGIGHREVGARCVLADAEDDRAVRGRVAARIVAKDQHHLLQPVAIAADDHLVVTLDGERGFRARGQHGAHGVFGNLG